jgi:hypothetical protein
VEVGEIHQRFVTFVCRRTKRGGGVISNIWDDLKVRYGEIGSPLEVIFRGCCEDKLDAGQMLEFADELCQSMDNACDSPDAKCNTQ